MNSNHLTLNDLDFDTIVQQLGLGPEHEIWRSTWHCSADTFDPTDPWFYKPGALEEACRFLRMSPPVIGAFVGTLAQFKTKPALKRLLWHCDQMLFARKAGQSSEAESWQMLPESSGAVGQMFYAFVYLAGLPRTRALHRQQGIPEQITIATLADLELHMHSYYKKHGSWGLDQPSWPSLYFGGKLFALGRLQFELINFILPFYVLQNNTTGQVLAMADDELRFRPDGQFEDADGLDAPEGVWTSRFHLRDSQIVGHVVGPRGGVRQEQSSLRSEDWRCVLQPDDPVLSVHIPATGPLEHDACRRSFAQAIEFYARYFPNRNFHAFTCISWLMDVQLKNELPASSNIVRFQNRFQPLPIPQASDTQIFERVFGGPIESADTVHVQTSLQQAVLAHIRRGGRWRMAGGYCLPSAIFTTD